MVMYTVYIHSMIQSIMFIFYVPGGAKIMQMSPAGPEAILRKGETLSLKCQAEGYPEPKIVWTRNVSISSCTLI